MVGRYLKAGGYLGIICAMPDKVKIGAATKGKAQRVQQNRLASAGLSGKHGQPSIEL